MQNQYTLVQYPISGQTELNAPINEQNIIDVEKYGDKYYIAVMHPRSGSNEYLNGSICVFSSSTGELVSNLNWDEEAVYSKDLSFPLKNEYYFGSDIKLVSGSEELLLFYSQYSGSTTEILCVTSSDGTTWSNTNTIFTPISSDIGASIDVLIDDEYNKLFIAYGNSKENPITDVEYSDYGTLGEGWCKVYSSSLDDPLNFGNSPLAEIQIPLDISSITNGGEIVASQTLLHGTSISLTKINNQYQLYSTLPGCWADIEKSTYVYDVATGTFSDFVYTTTERKYFESIWYNYSNDGKRWSSTKPVVVADTTNKKRNSFIGFGGIKAVAHNNKVYLFYSQPGDNTNIGSSYVVYSEDGGTWDPVSLYSENNKIKLLEGLNTNCQFTSYSNLVGVIGEKYRTFSVDALSTETGIYYAFGSARTSDLSGSLHFGVSEDGITFQQNGEIEVEIGTSANPLLGTSVSMIVTSSIEQGQIAACAYSDFFNVNCKTIGDSIIFKLDVESEKAKKAFRHAAIEPYFGPGIFYNTIKSGISVDWPAISGSTQYVPIFSDGQLVPINPYQPESVVMSSFSGSNGIYNARGSIRSKINYRIPFENLINPDEVFASKQLLEEDFIETYSKNTSLSNSEVTKFIDKTYIYGAYETYLNPIDINEIYLYGPRKFAVPFVYKDSKSSKKSALFSKAMNNCLAEIPNFFLEQEKVSIIQSEPDYNWLPLNADNTYYMDVVLEKNRDLVMMEGWHNAKHPTGSNGEKMHGRYFGYPVNKTNKEIWSGEIFTEEEARLIHNDPAYAPYTPPYFEGTAIARLSFSPKESKKYTLEEVFAEIQVEDIFLEASLGWVSGSDAEKHKMKIGSSIEIFDTVLSTTTEVASIGEFTDPNMTTVKEESNSKTWIIRPRIETPVLNFSKQEDTQFSKNYLKTGGFGRGMWSGYGQIPNEGEGIKIKLLYPFDSERQDQYLYGKREDKKLPLFDYIKFKNKEVEIGKIASQKQISEAIILIPYVDSGTQASKTHGTKKEYIDGLSFIKINQDIYNKQLKNIRAGKNAVTIEDGVEAEISETSITRMIRASEKYVLPPSINFFKYQDIEPFVMYVFEFEHTLNQDDLSHIWQGLMPDISYNAELDEVSIMHEFTPFDLFNGTELPDGMKWLVFKVKKRSEESYSNMINKSKTDRRFHVKLENGKSGEGYSYNWPYDFFSLVELAKVEIELEYTKGKTPPPLVGYTILPK
jgi:hypothetical protein